MAQRFWVHADFVVFVAIMLLLFILLGMGVNAGLFTPTGHGSFW